MSLNPAPRQTVVLGESELGQKPAKRITRMADVKQDLHTFQVVFLGMFSGSSLWGSMADKYGRWPVRQEKKLMSTVFWIFPHNQLLFGHKHHEHIEKPALFNFPWILDKTENVSLSLRFKRVSILNAMTRF